MKKFKTISDIKTERELQRNNKIIYNLLGVLIGELDRLPTREEPNEEVIYKQIMKLYNGSKEMSQYKQDAMKEVEYLNDFIKQQMNEEELTNIIKEYHNMRGINNIGGMMRELNTFHRGEFDGKMANEIIKKIL